MAYAQIRVKSLNAGDIRNTEIHNSRLYENLGIDVPDNIDMLLSEKNRVMVFDDDIKECGSLSLQEAINKREKNIQVMGIKKNSIHALEIVVSVSDINFFESERNPERYSAEAFADKVQTFFLNPMFGADNVIASYVHKDESKPHAHFIVLPCVEKEIRWKNKTGEGKRKEMRLDAQKYIGGKDKLRQLQQSFFEFCQKLESNSGREIRFYRGTLAEYQTREYTQQTNAEIGKLRTELSEIKTEAERKEIIAKIERKQSEFEKEISRLNEKQAKVEADRNRPSYDWTHSNKISEWGEKLKKKGFGFGL